MSNKILYPEGGNKMRAFVYILGASKKADEIELKCKVPFEIDENEIFFGPCKKLLRQKLKKEVDTNNKLDTETFFIGLNASNAKKERKIVWAGKIQNHYTFQQANEKLVGSKYLHIKTGNFFPLHVSPIKNGYQLIGKLHSENNNWFSDLVSNKDSIIPDKAFKSITLKKGFTFDRDICFTFSNIFFAKGNGIDIDKKVLNIFQKHLNTNDIDAYTVLGKNKKGRPNGMRGSWLELDSSLTQRLVKLIKKQAEQIKKKSNSSQTKTLDKTKQNHQGGCK